MISTPRSARALLSIFFLLCLATALGAQTTDSIPLPEHPRPDFRRDDWLNLNGRWQFRLDAADEGLKARWFAGELQQTRSILVPFSWGAPLSGVPDSADIGWYARSIEVPPSWRGKRIFLVVGASDWRTSVWLDGKKLGDHEGGYTPFSVELTPDVTYGTTQRLTIRVDDAPRPFLLEGKQGYGKARGMWQTVYLEARGTTPLEWVHFTPDIAHEAVAVEARLRDPAPPDLTLRLRFTNLRSGGFGVERPVPKGSRTVRFTVPLPNAHLWRLDDPFLYQVSVSLRAIRGVEDRINTYFGMRSISVIQRPGSTDSYVALNGKPIYLQLALDQAYHPTGYYTFPTDAMLRDEIGRAVMIGLNGLREHVKIETPRKLYWADMTGILIMADVPNSWGPPDSAMFREHDYAMREMIERDYNHPSIFAWVPFNEAWGLTTKSGNREVYLPATQRRVASTVRLARSLDPTRLVEDNSPCCGRGHVETDINSWHSYLSGWQWNDYLKTISDSTFPGSPWNFEKGHRQARQPNINSEFGNVWGYEGSTGDVDWSWDYHLAVNAFRRNPKIAGWLYTEHHDVINEWNGYWRFDRSNKETGFGGLVPGMTLRDLHAPFYIAVGTEMSPTVTPGQRVDVPLWASFMTDAKVPGDSLVLHFELTGRNTLGDSVNYGSSSRTIAYTPWSSRALDPFTVTMPSEPGVLVLSTQLTQGKYTVLQRNFMTFVVEGAPPTDVQVPTGQHARLLRVAPKEYTDARWSQKTWSVMDGLKVNGAGSGYFEYRIPWPADVDTANVARATFLVEASAKQLFGKDRDSTSTGDGDYMRGKGFHDPSRNPNSYPMTDGVKYPSRVTVRVNGEASGTYDLSDDPADHRGILSWHAQPRDHHLHEAGSYGQLLRVPVSRDAIARAAKTREFVVRLEVDPSLPGGLAIYGAHFGRYPLDPTLMLVLR